MTPKSVSVNHAHQTDGLYFVYFYVAVVTQPGDAPEPVSSKVAIVHGCKRSDHPHLAANVQIARLKDISPNATVKLKTFDPGTKRAQAEAWIDTPEGQTWAQGTVGGSLCQIVLAIPK